MTTHINILSDLSTPHNNSLLRELRKYQSVRVLAWYRFRRMHELPWEKELGKDQDDLYFDSFSMKLSLLKKIFFSSNEKFVLVGYSNFINLLSIIFFTVTFKEYYFWLDHPIKKVGIKNILRKIAYKIINFSAKKILVVGEKGKQFLIKENFNKSKLTNFSIYVDVPKKGQLLNYDKTEIRRRYNIPLDNIVGVSASRLTYEKGFHILIESFNKLHDDVINNFTLVLVGDGPEKNKLLNDVKKFNCESKVVFINWVEPEEYKKLIYCGDFYIHPAIFDAYGGGTMYAMSMSIPVIGSTGAGVVQERLVDGINGLCYEAYDVDGLSKHIKTLIQNNNVRNKLANNSRNTALKWTPYIGSKILLKELNL